MLLIRPPPSRRGLSSIQTESAWVGFCFAIACKTFQHYTQNSFCSSDHPPLIPCFSKRSPLKTSNNIRDGTYPISTFHIKKIHLSAFFFTAGQLSRFQNFAFGDYNPHLTHSLIAYLQEKQEKGRNRGRNRSGRDGGSGNLKKSTHMTGRDWII